MRKILIAVPCLLLSGLVAAKETSSTHARQGADGVLLATALDAAGTAEQPVVRQDGLQLEAAKRTSAQAAPAPAATPTDTSKRFNMTQNGKKMTADDFDAWMKKNGYRVATGAPATPKAEEPAKQGTK